MKPNYEHGSRYIMILIKQIKDLIVVINKYKLNKYHIYLEKNPFSEQSLPKYSLKNPSYRTSSRKYETLYVLNDHLVQLKITCH